MPDPKQIYEERRQALIQAQEALADLVIDLQLTFDSIQEWHRVLLPEEQDNPPQVFGSAIKLNADRWPTYEAFVGGLKTWRHAREEAERAYDDLPDNAEVERLPPFPQRREVYRFAVSRPRPRPRPKGPRKRRNGSRSLTRRPRR